MDNCFTEKINLRKIFKYGMYKNDLNIIKFVINHLRSTNNPYELINAFEIDKIVAKACENKDNISNMNYVLNNLVDIYGIEELFNWNILLKGAFKSQSDDMINLILISSGYYKDEWKFEWDKMFFTVHLYGDKKWIDFINSKCQINEKELYLIELLKK